MSQKRSQAIPYPQEVARVSRGRHRPAETKIAQTTHPETETLKEDLETQTQ